MAPPDETLRQCGRDAVLALHHAVRTLRQHADHEVLCRSAVRRAVDAVRIATDTEPLHLRLAQGTVHTDDSTLVLTFGASDVPFGALCAAGVGELVIGRGIEPAAVERLVRALAGGACTDDPDRDIAAALRRADLPHVRLRAATCGSPATAGPLPADWWLLPGRAPMADGLQPLIERELGANLLARAAQRVMADLDEDGAAPSAALEPLFAALLERGDVATAARLLDQACHHPGVPAPTAACLRARAQAVCGGEWLRQALAGASREQVLDLVALVMQLGDAAVDEFARVAATSARPFSGWLDELLGRRPR